MEERALGVITDSGLRLAHSWLLPRPHITGPHSQPEGALVEKGCDSETVKKAAVLKQRSL